MRYLIWNKKLKKNLKKTQNMFDRWEKSRYNRQTFRRTETQTTVKEPEIKLLSRLAKAENKPSVLL